MQFLYILQYFFSRRISHFISPLNWCVSLFGLFFVVVVVVFLLLLNIFWPCFPHLNDPKRTLFKAGDLWKPSRKKIVFRTDFFPFCVNHRI